MKKTTLFILTVALLYSCSNKDKQMLRDYQQKNVSSLNFDIKDLDFDVQSIKKISDITASDSMGILKAQFAKYWKKDADQSLIDTLSFDYVKDVLNRSIIQTDTLINLYQESVLLAIRGRNYSYEYDSKRKRDKAIEDNTEYKKMLLEVENIEKRYNELSKTPEEILSTKYKATYSMKNPLMGNAKQTFNKFFYTNAERTEFIKEESIDTNDNTK